MWYDIAVLVVLGFALLHGAMKGFVWQLATIAALVCGFGFATSFSPAVAAYLPAKPPLNRWLAMFVLYLAISFVAFAVGRTLKDWIDKARFGAYDRHLGALFGLVKGVLFSLVVTFFIVTLSVEMRETVLNSRSGQAAAIIMDRLHPVLPEELHELLEPYIHRLDKAELDLHHRTAKSPATDSAGESAPWFDFSLFSSPSQGPDHHHQ